MLSLAGYPDSHSHYTISHATKKLGSHSQSVTVVAAGPCDAVERIRPDIMRWNWVNNPDGSVLVNGEYTVRKLN
jgi:hypothetical protein